MDDATRKAKFPDLHVYVAVKRMKKWELAKALGISPSRLSHLLYPERYGGRRVSDELVAQIAELLNQPESYVRKLYNKSAA